jgi:hypothetical protein
MGGLVSKDKKGEKKVSLAETSMATPDWLPTSRFRAQRRPRCGQ